MGDKQSGIADFKLGNIVKDTEIMRKAKDEMRELLKLDREEFFRENEDFVIKANYLKKEMNMFKR